LISVGLRDPCGITAFAFSAGGYRVITLATKERSGGTGSGRLVRHERAHSDPATDTIGAMTNSRLTAAPLALPPPLWAVSFRILGDERCSPEMRPRCCRRRSEGELIKRARHASGGRGGSCARVPRSAIGAGITGGGPCWLCMPRPPTAGRGRWSWRLIAAGGSDLGRGHAFSGRGTASGGGVGTGSPRVFVARAASRAAANIAMLQASRARWNPEVSAWWAVVWAARR
jgi:hypothetical protein